MEPLLKAGKNKGNPIVWGPPAGNALMRQIVAENALTVGTVWNKLLRCLNRLVFQTSRLKRQELRYQVAKVIIVKMVKTTVWVSSMVTNLLVILM
jgi:small-conductance mechanosensitive channel